MSSTMSFRDLYLVAGATFDRAAARAMVVRLCNEASPAELDQVDEDEDGWLVDDDPAEFDQLDHDGGLNDTAVADLDAGSEEQIAALRRRATESLGLAVDQIEEGAAASDQVVTVGLSRLWWRQL